MDGSDRAALPSTEVSQGDFMLLHAEIFSEDARVGRRERGYLSSHPQSVLPGVLVHGARLRFGRLKGTAQAKHLLKLQCDGQRANTQLTTCLQAVERDMDERYEGLTLLVEEKSAGESRVGCCL